MRMLLPIVVALLVTGCTPIEADDEGDEPVGEMRAEVIGFGPSDAGRVDVTFEVHNETNQAVPPWCFIRGFDADGYRAGTDHLSSDEAIDAGESERYRSVVGIDFDGVDSVEVECRVR